MPIASTFLTLLNTVLLAFILYLVYKNRKVTTVTGKEAINRIVALEKTAPVDTPAPNEASKKPEKTQVLDENVVWNIPKDVKIAVEGGDTNIPPDFEV